MAPSSQGRCAGPSRHVPSPVLWSKAVTADFSVSGTSSLTFAGWSHLLCNDLPGDTTCPLSIGFLSISLSTSRCAGTVLYYNERFKVERVDSRRFPVLRSSSWGDDADGLLILAFLYFLYLDACCGRRWPQSQPRIPMVLKLGQAAGPTGLCCPDLWVGVLPKGTPHSWESLGVHAGLLMGELRAVRPWATVCIA